MITHAISSIDIARGVVDGLIPIYKRLGETPLEALGRLRHAFPSLEKVPLTYAGRLDPIAEGLLLVLSGTFNNRREEFLGLDKLYEIEVLFGIATDTGDVMGKLKSNQISIPEKNITLVESVLEELSKKIIGTHEFPYPFFSSKTVQGKPLHVWAREGRLHEIEIPKTKTIIYDASFVELKLVDTFVLENEISHKINLVNGDFRQIEILNEWSFFLNSLNNSGICNLHVAKFRIQTASGAYMRTLAEYIGKSFGCASLAYSIKRLAVGSVTISDCINL